MAVSYNKHWSLVRQNKMKTGDLARAAEISNYTVRIKGKGRKEHVETKH